ncbi:protein of unknown function [Streptomyces murinus]
MHPVHLAVRQRGPAELPGATRCGGAVEDHEVAVRLESGAAHVIGAGQSCLTSAYDDHLDLTQFVHASTNSVPCAALPARCRTHASGWEPCQMPSPPES